jgi:hypothetical protein
MEFIKKVKYRKEIFMFVQKKSVIAFILCSCIITTQLYSMNETTNAPQEPTEEEIMIALVRTSVLGVLPYHILVKEDKGFDYLKKLFSVEYGEPQNEYYEIMNERAQLAQALLTRVDKNDLDLYPKLTQAVTDFQAKWGKK